MPTQRTRTTGRTPSGPQGPVEPEDSRVETVEVSAEERVEDLGIPDGMIDDDPSGFVPSSPVQEIAGRKVRQVTPADLAQAHQQYSPGVRITGERVPSPDGMRTEPSQQQAQAQDLGVAAQAQNLLPQAFRQQEPPSRPDRPTQNQQPQTPESSEVFQDVTRAASSFEYLVRQDRAARASGDPERASQTAALIGSLKSQVNVEEKPAQAGRSPVLQRMVEHFGLEKIKPVEIEWGGFKWRFGPTNTRLDIWVGENLAGNGYNAAALLVAASTIGIDDEPIYKVMNLPLVKEYEISNLANTVTKQVTLPLYNKQCSCGNDLLVESTKCGACGAQVDKFDIPLELRVEAANRFYHFLEESFGAYEELSNLVVLKDQQMKNRVLNREELYPFLSKKPSSGAPKTQG